MPGWDLPMKTLIQTGKQKRLQKFFLLALFQILFQMITQQIKATLWEKNPSGKSEDIFAW